jgi:hypothetical protein
MVAGPHNHSMPSPDYPSWSPILWLNPAASRVLIPSRLRVSFNRSLGGMELTAARSDLAQIPSETPETIRLDPHERRACAVFAYAGNRKYFTCMTT